LSIADHITKDYKLAVIGYNHPQIGYGTLYALLAGTASIGLGWKSTFCFILYMSLASFTRVRPAHLCHARAIKVLNAPSYGAKHSGGDGAVIGDFKLWYKRQSPRSNPKIYGWFSPRGGKTRHSTAISFPLAPAPILGLSTATLLLIYAGIFGALGEGGTRGTPQQQSGHIVFLPELQVFFPHLGLLALSASLNTPLFPGLREAHNCGSNKHNRHYPLLI
jgi:hypothetical protein